MVTAQDIENARRLYVAALGTPREQEARADFELLIEQARRQHRERRAS